MHTGGIDLKYFNNHLNDFNFLTYARKQKQKSKNYDFDDSDAL